MQTYFLATYPNKVREVQLVRGERAKFASDWRAVGNVVSSEWRAKQQIFEIVSQDLDANVSSVLVTCTGVGEELIENVATFDDGQVRSRQYEINLVSGKISTCGEVYFSPTTYTSDFTSVTVYVVRADGSNGAAEIAYATQDGTAEAGINYTETTGTLTWADGEEGEKSIVIPIIAGVPIVSSFTVVITLVSGCISIGDDTATVSIPDEDFVPIHVLVGNTAQFSSGDIVWDKEAYDRGNWWASGAGVVVPADVSYVRVTGQTGSAFEESSQHTKNGSTFIGAAFEDSLSQGSDFTNLSSGPIPVVQGDIFRQTTSTSNISDCWMHVEKIDAGTKMALIYNSGTQSISASTETALTFNAELHDNAGFFSGSGSKIIIPAGVSTVQVCAWAETSSVAGAFRIHLTVNGAQQYGCPKKSEDTTGADRLTLASATLSVSQGDEIECIVQTVSASVIQANAWMSITQIPFYHRRALVYKSESQSFPSNTIFTATWGATAYDDSGFVANNTSFRIPAGFTQARLAASAEIPLGTGIQLYMHLLKNNAYFQYRFEDHSDLAGNNSVSGMTGWLDVVEGDEFSLRLTAGSIAWPDNKSSWFFIECR